MKKIILLSDSHNSLDKRIFKYLENCDEIWHAGDIGKLEITDTLKKYAPVRAVWGNIDNHTIRKEFKRVIFFKCERIRVMMTHIGGYPGKYNKAIENILIEKKPDLFISGHSHILKVIRDKKYNLIHMNPGAIGDYGLHKVKTILSFNIEDIEIKDLKVIEFSRKTN
tara:strand:- start:49 stop:549 length:501 start_codon:yes stop_codon:yes gene_type:complete